MSGLDWFPTFVAIAGNPNIAEELKKGKQLGTRTYKVHLDGYDQTNLITGKGPSNRHEIFYFAEGTLGAVRFNDYKYRFIDQPGGWLGGTVKVDWPILVNLRLDPFERTGMTGSIAYYSWFVVPVLEVCPRARGGWQGGADPHRVSADAEGRVIQYGSGERAGREGDSVALGRVNGNLFNLGPSGSAQRIHGHLFTAHGSLGHGRDPSKHGRLTRLDPGADGQCCLPVSRCVSPPYLGPAFDDE